jgi:hypothetical protein
VRNGVRRVRSNPLLAVAVVAGALLVLAWIAWAIHVASDRGGREALGVLIVWPAIAVAVALIAFAFYGVYLLIRGQRREEGSGETLATGSGHPSKQQG